MEQSRDQGGERSLAAGAEIEAWAKQFLVEAYVSRADPAEVELGGVRAGRAAAELSREGTRVRYLRSIFVPEDETCFFLYEADRAEDVAEAARRAALRFERVSEAIEEEVR